MELEKANGVVQVRVRLKEGDEMDGVEAVCYRKGSFFGLGNQLTVKLKTDSPDSLHSKMFIFLDCRIAEGARVLTSFKGFVWYTMK
jgi:hypothetical protein